MSWCWNSSHLWGIMLWKSRPNSLFIIILRFIFILPLFVRGSHQKRWYLNPKQQKTWSEAQTYCRENHDDLATFRQKVELNRISGVCNSPQGCWIGLYRDKNDPNVWNWSDGENTNFRSWKDTQPDNYRGIENCVATQDNGGWFDQNCDVRLAFLCYEDDLILVKENKTWEEALEHCRTLVTVPASNKHLYDLPDMHLQATNMDARRMIQDAQTEEVWIGLRYLAGHWLWVNKNALDGQWPACPAAGMYCGTMSKMGDLYSEKNCLERRNFFCSTTN